jgi:kynureninase
MVAFLARVERARSVSLSHPDTLNGMSYLVALGIITSARRTEILNG